MCGVWYGMAWHGVWVSVYALFFCFLLLFYPSLTIGLILYSSQLFGNLVVGYHWLSAVHFASTRRKFILAVCWNTNQKRGNDTNDKRNRFSRKIHRIWFLLFAKTIHSNTVISGRGQTHDNNNRKTTHKNKCVFLKCISRSAFQINKHTIREIHAEK